MEAKQCNQKVKLPLFVTEKDYIQKVSLWWTSRVTNRQFWNGKNTQALEYLKIYLDETNVVEDEILKTPQTPPPLGMLMAEDILQQYANVFRPGRRTPRDTYAYWFGPFCYTCTYPYTPRACGKVRPGKWRSEKAFWRGDY